MNTPQKEKAFKRMQRENHAVKMKNRRLRSKIAEMIRTEGVEVDEDLATRIKILLESDEAKQKMTPMQRIFIEQQVKAATVKSATLKSRNGTTTESKCGMKWHPAIIRFAFSIEMNSPSAYRFHSKCKYNHQTMKRIDSENVNFTWKE